VISLSFWVPGPVIPLARPRVVNVGGKVRAFTPSTSQNYKKLVGIYALNARNRLDGWRLDWADYSIDIQVQRESLKGDWDNLAKGIQDGLIGVLFDDDRYVTSAHVLVSGCASGAHEGAAVTVSMLGEVDAETARAARVRAKAQARRAAKGPA
jgi:Holliday junction resolvase RusA-like endonuclease